MKVSNIIALFHVMILPFIIYFIYQETLVASLWAVSLLSFSVLLDLIDRFFEESDHDVKSFIHPFADKLVVLVLLLVFTLHGSFSPVILTIFIVRDLVVGIIRILASRDDVEIKASKYYNRTIISLQFTLVYLLLIKDFFIYWTSSGLIWNFSIISIILIVTLVTVFLALISMVYYALVYTKGFREIRNFGNTLNNEKMVILANRKSGGYKHRYRRHLLKIFAKRRKAKIIYLPKINLFKGMFSKTYDAEQVVIAGGDGTFESALNNKYLQKKSLGFFPFGTGNAYYSYFYRGKRFEYMRSRFPFQEVDLDIIELEWEKGKRQTTFLGLGIDGEVMKLSKNKKYHTFLDYFIAGYKVAFSKRVAYDLHCNIDGRKYHWDNCFNLILGKVPFFGFGMRSLFGRMKPNDGFILGLASVNTHSPFFNKALRTWQLFLTQNGLAKSPLVPLKGKEYYIKSDKLMALQAGGEFIGYTKWIKVKVLRKQKVLMV